MMNKIKFIIGTLLLCVFGYRPYILCAKWKSLNNELSPFAVVLLPRNLPLNSGEALVTAIDQLAPFEELFKQNYVFDHFEKTSWFSYFQEKLIY